MTQLFGHGLSAPQIEGSCKHGNQHHSRSGHQQHQPQAGSRHHGVRCWAVTHAGVSSGAQPCSCECLHAHQSLGQVTEQDGGLWGVHTNFKCRPVGAVTKVNLKKQWGELVWSDLLEMFNISLRLLLTELCQNYCHIHYSLCCFS